MGETNRKDALTHREPHWPVGAYAPGGYMGKCLKCEGTFFNMDKRAIRCFPCAVDGIQAALEIQRVEMAALKQENETLRSAIQVVEARP